MVKSLKIKDSFEEVFKDKERILVVAAHPDDNEVICGGTVARLIAEGKKVRLVVCTNGEKGVEDKKGINARDFANTRIAEQIEAGKALGIPEDQNFNLKVPDGELEASVENIGKIVYHIRDFKPDIIITHNPDEVINTFSEKENIRWVNHRDHRHSALIAVDAAYPYSRDRGFFPKQLEKLEPHTVEYLLLSDSYTNPQRVYFDVTDFIDKKRAALVCCKSVVPEEHVDSYIEELKHRDRYYEVLRFVKM